MRFLPLLSVWKMSGMSSTARGMLPGGAGRNLIRGKALPFHVWSTYWVATGATQETLWRASFRWIGLFLNETGAGHNQLSNRGKSYALPEEILQEPSAGMVLITLGPPYVLRTVLGSTWRVWSMILFMCTWGNWITAIAG